MIKDTSYNRTTALIDSGLTFPERQLYLYICEVSGWKKSVFTQPHKTIVRNLGIGEAVLQKYLRTLAKKEFILRINHYNSFNSVHPLKICFIYPMKYHEELFDKESSVKISENAINEINKMTEGLNGSKKVFQNNIVKAKNRIN